MKFSLPCSCGRSLVVEVSQAGQMLRCACGKDVEVPAMRLIRQLEPARDVAPTKRKRKKSWSRLQGSLFAVGLAIMVGGSAWAAYFQWGRSKLDTEETKWDNLDEALETIDGMNLDYAWKFWTEMRDSDIGPYRPPEFVLSRIIHTFWFRHIVTGLGLAVVGFIMICSAFLLPEKGRPRPKNPPAKRS